MADEILRAPIVVSGAGVATTVNRLLARGRQRTLNECLQRVDSSVSSLFVFGIPGIDRRP